MKQSLPHNFAIVLLHQFVFKLLFQILKKKKGNRNKRKYNLISIFKRKIAWISLHIKQSVERPFQRTVRSSFVRFVSKFWRSTKFDLLFDRERQFGVVTSIIKNSIPLHFINFYELLSVTRANERSWFLRIFATSLSQPQSKRRVKKLFAGIT